MIEDKFGTYYILKMINLDLKTMQINLNQKSPQL